MKVLFAKPSNPESFLASAMNSEIIGTDGRTQTIKGAPMVASPGDGYGAPTSERGPSGPPTAAKVSWKRDFLPGRRRERPLGASQRLFNIVTAIINKPNNMLLGHRNEGWVLRVAEGRDGRAIPPVPAQSLATLPEPDLPETPEMLHHLSDRGRGLGLEEKKKLKIQQLRKHRDATCRTFTALLNLIQKSRNI